MRYSQMLNETEMTADDYPLASMAIEENGWLLSTYPVEGATRVNSHKLCDIHIQITSPEGEVWTENRGPIYTNDGLIEAEGALKTAKWVKAHWAEVMQSQC